MLGTMRVEIRVEQFDSTVARRLNAEVQAEYEQRYGSGDQTVLEATDFIPPQGVYVIAYRDGEPLASGAWRAHSDNDAEMKRLYVTPQARGLGLARAIVEWLETDARSAGRSRMILESGDEQPEALALYDSLGYRPITPFGYYAKVAGASHLGKSLAPSPELQA